MEKKGEIINWTVMGMPWGVWQWYLELPKVKDSYSQDMDFTRRACEP
jgi:hypothetical protein